MFYLLYSVALTKKQAHFKLQKYKKQPNCFAIRQKNRKFAESF